MHKDNVFILLIKLSTLHKNKSNHSLRDTQNYHPLNKGNKTENWNKVPLTKN